MKKIIFLIIAAILLFEKFPGERSAKFHISEQAYLTNVANLTTTRELTDFIASQSAIYIDNVYSLMQKFFYKILGELPKSMRTRVLKEIANEMDAFLDDIDAVKKLKLFDRFVEEFSELYDDIFEFDETATLLDAQTFNDIYVTNGVEEVLYYANTQQAGAFVEHTGNGIRKFLLHNRLRLKQQQLLELKANIDQFLERVDFRDKRKALKALLQHCKQYLD